MLSEKIVLGKYVAKHQKEFDEIMTNLFKHFNELGKIEPTGKVQLQYLATMLNLFVTKSGIPKKTQKETVKALLKSL